MSVVAIEVQPVDSQGKTIQARAPELSYTVDDVLANKNYVELRWSDIRYAVPNGKAEKVLIHGVTGVARSGTVTALMGSSGAGKSTLLDLLAGRIQASSRIQGDVTVNGVSRDSIKGIKNVIAYVMQNDALYPLLTVKETITYSANLRLPMLTQAERDERVRKVIEELGLQHVQDSPIGDDLHRGISGGEKRRVSIGVELVIQPKILFLDEPTSGLDSASAYDVVNALQRVARGEGTTGKRCVILSIHQPNSKIFSMIDNVLFLGQGHIVYYGKTARCGQFLAYLGQPVPEHTNPADHILDVVTDYQKNNSVKTMVDAFEEYTMKEFQQSDDNSGPLAVEAKRKPEASSHPVPAPLQDDEPARVAWYKQVYILWFINFLNTMRTKELFVQRIGVNCFISFIMGTLFLFPSGATETSDYNSFLIFSVALLNFTSVEVLPIFLDRRLIFFREYANGYYSLGSFVLADFMMALPVAASIGFTYSFIGYWLTGLNSNAGNYFTFIYAVFLMSMAANSFVVMVSSFVPNGIAGNALCSTVFAFMFLFSGFFIKRDDIPGYWVWFHYLSLFKYGFEAVLVNQYDDNLGTTFACNRVALVSNSACRLTPSQVKADLDVDGVNKFGAIGCLWAFAIGYRLLMLIILKLKGTKRK